VRSRSLLHDWAAHSLFLRTTAALFALHIRIARNRTVHFGRTTLAIGRQRFSRSRSCPSVGRRASTQEANRRRRLDSCRGKPLFANGIDRDVLVCKIAGIASTRPRARASRFLGYLGPSGLAFTRQSALPTPRLWAFSRLASAHAPTDAVAPADNNIRFEADADSYSFIASDLYRLLLPGLPAHNERVKTRPIRQECSGRAHSDFGNHSRILWEEIASIRFEMLDFQWLGARCKGPTSP
jgi:hypothetical protein